MRPSRAGVVARGRWKPSLPKAEAVPGTVSAFDSPEAAAAHCWQMLVRASRDRKAAWRTPVLATLGADGAPRARVLVLRRVDPGAGLLWLHSDNRSAKVGELGAEPRVALTFYDARKALQLRLEGEATLVADAAVVADAWARVPEPARRNYATVEPPGSPTGPGEAALSGDGAANFALIEVRAARLEWLWLGPEQHRRGESRRAAPDADGWVSGALVP
jgi:predicted pyridoxine 5'-phosphate oxidase superfamily flavin-nucleotide-binding protein